MKNQRGSAVALVLLVMAVISLIGVTALVQSKLDLGFATALQSYNKMFNLADGGARIALKSLNKTNYEPYPTVTDGKLSAPPVAVESKTIPNVGEYNAQLQFFSYSTAASAVPGWEGGSYYVQYWAAEGVGSKERALGDAQSVVDMGAFAFSQK